MKLVLVIALAACSKTAKTDECQTIIDKSRTVMANRQADGQAGEPEGRGDVARSLSRLARQRQAREGDGLHPRLNGRRRRARVLTDGLKSYRDHARTTEATMMLNKIGKNAKVAFVEAAQFPVGNVGATPATPCCKQPGNTCAPNAADWTNPAWQALSMTIDEPFRFQYSYQSDGKTFTATAAGDPSCDGNPVTLTSHGMIENGEPRVTED